MEDGERTLNDLKNGATAAVARIDIEGPTKRRLVEMGITPGTRLRLTKRAPLGDPLEIALRGYLLTLRAEDARRIWVTDEHE